LVCIDRNSGQEIWAVDVDKDFECDYHMWGNSETPLIVDDKVICTPGGKKTSVVAFDKMTGKLIWQSKSLGGQRAYASATIFEYDNFRYILAVIGTDLIALVPETGEIVWNYKYFNPEKWDQPGLIWTNTPIFKDNMIFLTMGYDYNAKMIKMAADGKSVSEVFTDTIFDNHHHGVILTDGYLYGSNWRDNKRGNWVCMKWDTGEIMYETEWDTKGAMVMADGLLYCYNEKGNVGLVAPDPSGFKVISEFKITEGAGPHWAHPFIADGKLLIRHGDVLMVYDIKNK
jgi:outer membrane protein assembly factor BamB